MAEVVLVSRPIGAVTGGGIGSRMIATIELLAEDHSVTVITTDANQALLDEFAAAMPTVRIATIPADEPAHRGYFHPLQLWSAKVFERICALYEGAAGPDLIEFSDYLAEGFVTIQARRTAHPLLANTLVVVNLATTIELCDVLNGSVADDVQTTAMYDMERYCLANADRLLHGRGDIYETYERFYGAENLAPDFLLDYVSVVGPVAHRPASPPESGEPLRLLFAARVERRKGVHNLVEALAGSRLEDWTLTIAGADTLSGPLHSSMSAFVERLARDDPRIAFADVAGHEAVAQLIVQHDAVISPSIWECGPNIGLESLACNRPFLGTPVGGQLAMAIEGESGMLADGNDRAAVFRLVERAVAERAALRRLAEAGGPNRRLNAIADREAARRQYRDLAATAPRRQQPRSDPKVSIVIPYFRMADYVEETVISACGQDYPNLEVLIVNDGSFEADDAILERIAADYPVTVINTVNRGLSAARNFGIRQSTGKYVIPLDADDTVDPRFTARAVEVLEGDDSVAFVSSWLRCFSDAGAPLSGPPESHPLGNDCKALDHKNVAAVSFAMMRRELFELGYWYDELLVGFEDWALYLALRDGGHIGHVIPEYLYNYRIRGDSKLRGVSYLHQDQLECEVAATMRNQSMQWIST